MDPNPKKFPILSYVLSKLPSSNRSQSPDSDFDIEQPPLPPPSSTAEQPYFELTERMPYLNNPDLIAAMHSTVKDVSATRSVLKTLGEPPDHELVDIARAKLQNINLNDDDDDKVDSETVSFKAVIKLYEMHEAYEKMLSEAEKRLEKLYEAAKIGGKDGKAVAEDCEVEGSCSEVVDDELVRIMNDAIVNNVEKVDLSERKLPFLPEAFGKCRMLVSLNLSSNQLEVIPDSIAGLENLEELYASNNLLESLPDSIGLLLKLKILNVSSNKLTSLPDSICHCRSLVELDAGFNKLTYIPTNIGYELVNLKKLLVPLNKLRSLPTSIGEMESLQILDAHFNELRVLPPSIGRLSKLEILNLSGNFSDLTSLPHTIGELTNLEELDISNNQIHELPVTFGRLEKLTKLNVEENPLETPPKEVVKAGVEAVKEFMALRLLDYLVKEEEKSNPVENVETQAGWLTRSTSWLTNAVAGAVGGFVGGDGTTKKTESYLNEQF